MMTGEKHERGRKKGQKGIREEKRGQKKGKGEEKSEKGKGEEKRGQTLVLCLGDEVK